MKSAFRHVALAVCCIGIWAQAGACAPAGAPDEGGSDIVEIEYDGKVIAVNIEDIILMSGEAGYELDNPEKYAEALESARPYGEGVPADAPASVPGGREITAAEYREEQRARKWLDVEEDVKLREIDKRALSLVKEFSEAKGAVPPSLGQSGAVVVTYSSYIPKVVCRPMYVTDIILQPGEVVTGVHPGDAVRWQFVPSRSGSGDAEQIHVLVKPLMADISTNLIVNTDRRTYNFDLVANAKNYMPSVSFRYPKETMNEWDAFLTEKRSRQAKETELSSGYGVDPEALHMDYEIRGKETLRWKPVRVWDDGVKTYIRFPKGSTQKSVEAPVFVVFEHKKEVLVNYRATNDMYIVDRVFEKGALIVGTGSHQERVVITRKGAQ